MIAVFGLASLVLLMVTAAMGLWLDFGYGADATDAWNDIGRLQGDIERGLFVANLHRWVGLAALVETMAWLAVSLAERRQLPMLVAAALIVSIAARFAESGLGSVQRSVVECAAAVLALVAAIYWLSRPHEQVVPG